MKKNKILLLILGLFFVFMGKVNAVEGDTNCNSISLNELRTLAASVKINYIEGSLPKTMYDGESGESYETEESVLFIKIYNLSSKLYITYETDIKNVDLTGDNNKVNLLMLEKDADKDGVITLKQDLLYEMVTYTFNIYSMEYGCNDKLLRTIKITLPRFNYYSQFTICQDIPDYYLCKKYVTFNSDNNPDFYEKVTEYKAKLEEKKNKEDDDNNGIISETLSTVSKNKYVIVGVIVAVGVVITVLILRRKRSGK